MTTSTPYFKDYSIFAGIKEFVAGNGTFRIDGNCLYKLKSDESGQSFHLIENVAEISKMSLRRVWAII